MTADELREVMPYSAGRVDAFVQPLTDALAEFDINTARRRAAFLAQVAHESGELRYLRELSDGKQYEGRGDLGNDQPGDGPRYRGGGLLQITGRANFRAAGTELSLPLEDNPSLIETPAVAARSAAWFWEVKGLSALADDDLFAEITRRINGGYNGLDNRLRYWLAARKAENL